MTLGVAAGVHALLERVTSLIGIFRVSKEKRAVRAHAERLGDQEIDARVIDQFAAEFRDLSHRGWWDSFVDGLNRLPRPLIALGLIAFFGYTAFDPLTATKIAQSYAILPDGFWALVGVVVAFYFAGRLQLKSQSFQLTKAQRLLLNAMAQAREAERHSTASASTEGDRPLSDEDLARAMADPEPLSNAALTEWNRRRREASTPPKAGGD